MPVYQYEGVHYSLPDGLSDEEAVGKIKAHLGKGGASPSGPSMVDRAKDAVKGTVEAGLNLAGGIGSMFVAPVGAGLSALNDLGSGKAPHFLKDYETIMGKGGTLGTQLADATGMRSETGDTFNENIGQFINQVGIPGGLGASTLGFGPRVAPSPRVPMAREPVLSPVDKAIAEAQARKEVPPAKPVEVPEGVRAQQELFNREEFKPEVPKTDTTPQMELPFAAGPEEILREQYKNAPERDMFVEQDIADRAKDPVREQMAAETQKAAEVDQAYAQRAQQENLAARVEELKQKLEAPRRGPRGQSGAIDMEIVKGLTDSFNIKKILHDIDLITSSKNIDNIYTYIEKNKNKNSLEALFNRIDNENTIKTLNKNQYIKPPGTRMIGGGKIKRNSGRYGRQRGAIDVEAVKELGALFKQGAATAMDVLRSFKGAFTENEHGLAMKSVTNPKSLDTVALMSPEEFHQLASGRTPAELNASYTPRLHESIREGLKSKNGLWEMPYLRVDKEGQVTAHEGRHRMDVFKEQGIELVPVRLRKEAGKGWGEAERPMTIIPQDFRNSPGSVKAVAALPFPETLHQPKAVQLPRSQRGAIILAEKAGKDIELAKKLLKQKMSPATVFDLTGVYKEAGKFKTAISDADAKILPKAKEQLEHKTLTLDKVIDHDALFKLYPELKNVLVMLTNSGSRFYRYGKIMIIHIDESAPFKSILFHEIQHAIQEIEGFKKGGNPIEIMNRLNLSPEEGFKQYHKLPGEQEARFTESAVDKTQPSLNAEVKDLLKAESTPGTPERLFSLPKSQRGALDFGKPAPEKAKVVDDLLKTKLYQESTDPKTIVKDALAEGKDGSGSILLSAGGTLEGAKRNSELIKGGVRIVQRLKNIAEDKIRTSVFPVEKRLRKLSSTELQDLSKVMKSEMFDGTPVPMERLAEIFSEKQLAAYSEMRRMFKDALDTQNEARAKQGLDPITAQEAYLSSRWRGDFRRAIYNKEGKLVWYLAAETKKGLDTQAQALVKKFPDLAGGDHVDHVTRSVGRDNLQSLYSTMLDVLGRDDPKVEQVRQWVEDQTRMEAEGALAQTKHFEKKSNVRGFIGDRPSNTMFGKLDPKKEALAMFQEQINYAKNAHKWASLQEAGAQLKEIFSNEDLQTQQPKNMQYLREYYLDQVGMGTAKVVRHLEDAFKETGISPKAVEGGINSIKSLWISQKLVASAGFMLSNVIQAGNMIPHLIDLQRTYKGNPLALPAALISGFAEGMLMATGHLTGTAKEMINSAKYRPGDSVFSAKAMKYAEDNSVIARSIYDEAPIESSFSNTGRIANGLGKTISMPEAFLRSVVYMTYVNMLKYGGKLTNDMEIFRIAEEKTNISMGDYRTGERALIFSKLGTTGSALNLLQTYPMNYYNQWSWAARETMRGNAAPAAAMFAVQATAAGAMGIPGFQDMDKLWHGIKNILADHAPKAWNSVKDVDLKEMVLNQFGETGLYGALSKASGVSVTSRAAAPAGSEMLANPLAPAIDLAKQSSNVASALLAPSDKQKTTQALLGSAPVGLQGYLETGPLKDQTSVERNGQRVYGKTTDLAAREGQYSRSPEEERLRSFGLRSQKETFEKDLAYRTRSKDVQAATVASKLPDRVYNEVRKGNIDEAKVYIRMYAEITGKPMTEDMFQSRIMDEYTTTAEKATMKAKTLPGIAALKNLRDLLKEQNANQ